MGQRLVHQLVLQHAPGHLGVKNAELTVGHVGDGGVQRVDHVPPAIGAVVARGELLEGARAGIGVGGRGRQDLLQHPAGSLDGRRVVQERLHRRQRASRVVQVLEPAGRDLLERRQGLLARQGVQSLVPEVDELTVAVLLLQQALERGRDHRIAGFEVEHPSEVVDGELRLAGAVLGDVRRLLEQRRLPFRILGLGDGPVVLRQQLLPPPAGGQLERDPIEGPLGRGVELEHPVQQLGERRLVLDPVVVVGDGPLRHLGRGGRVEVASEHLAVALRRTLDAVLGPRRGLQGIPHRVVARSTKNRLPCCLERAVCCHRVASRFLE